MKWSFPDLNFDDCVRSYVVMSKFIFSLIPELTSRNLFFRVEVKAPPSPRPLPAPTSTVGDAGVVRSSLNGYSGHLTPIAATNAHGDGGEKRRKKKKRKKERKSKDESQVVFDNPPDYVWSNWHVKMNGFMNIISMQKIINWGTKTAMHGKKRWGKIFTILTD